MGVGKREWSRGSRQQAARSRQQGVVKGQGLRSALFVARLLPTMISSFVSPFKSRVAMSRVSSEPDTIPMLVGVSKETAFAVVDVIR